MRLRGAELRTLRIPLRSAFRTSFGSESVREVLLVRLVFEEVEGWGECVADRQPLYSSEYVAGAVEVMRTFLLPRLVSIPTLSAEGVAEALAAVSGHRMSKAALEMAVLDAQLRACDESLGSYLGATRSSIPAGVSVGIQDSLEELVETVAGYVEQGYVRIKLKIEPGWDVIAVRAVREAFGGDLPLQVDANAAYSLADAATLARLDEFDLIMIEQPLGNEDLRQHAELAKVLSTPICLDESIVSAASAADAIALGAARIINIKPGRVGGYLEARRIHDLAQAHGVAVWCGGMLETGLGRRANIALAALPGFTLPGDTSASDRYYERDLTDPVILEGGHVRVPTGPGIGAVPDEDALREFTVTREWTPA